MQTAPVVIGTVPDVGPTRVDPWADLAWCTGAELTALITDTHVEVMERECRLLQLACAWADQHDLDSSRGDYQPLIERACAWGGNGTPEVSEYCTAELGALQGTGTMAARMLIADALDLRHRLPRLWTQVRAGQVRAWKARVVAQETRMLSWEAAVELDHAIAGYIGMLPWARFLRLLAATILAADPAAAAERADRARTERTVWASDSDHGLKVVVARAASGDVTWFMATVNRIAEILLAQGDTDLVGARRSKAIGILAQPAVALQLLFDHRTDPAEPEASIEPSPEPEPASELKTESRTTEPSPEPEPEPEPAFASEPDLPSADPSPISEPDVDPRAEDQHRSLDLTPLPAGFDADAARPSVVLHFHLTEATVRAGQGLVRPEHRGILTFTQLLSFLGDTGCRVRIQPVFNPGAVAPIDAYEVSQRIRESVRLRNLADTFPYGVTTSRSMDLDHSEPYVPMSRGGPPGQTRPDNLGPLNRSHHRAVTHGRWQRRQPSGGVYVFRSPHGYVFVVNNQGTLNLGRNAFADRVWRTTRSTVSASPAPVAA